MYRGVPWVVLLRKTPHMLGFIHMGGRLGAAGGGVWVDLDCLWGHPPYIQNQPSGHMGLEKCSLGPLGG